jgi:hypothetical protein
MKRSRTRSQVGSVRDGLEGRVVESGFIRSKVGCSQPKVADLDVSFVIYK